VRRRQYTDREEKPKKAYICIDLCFPALFVLGVLWEELQCFCYCGSWITSLVCGSGGCFWRDIKLLESSCRGLRRAWFRCLTTGSKVCPRDGEVVDNLHGTHGLATASDSVVSLFEWLPSIVTKSPSGGNAEMGSIL
jgi:hypothetical protein